MPEIFISYRRIDTEPSAGHLFSDLCRSFGVNSVFMDTRPGGLSWGADWESGLNAALNGCDVLIVLIGLQWTRCERTPGCRRLDEPDDWVRGEIATALRRAILVLPVLFQGASMAPEAELPAELRSLGFAKRQAYPISESRWDTDVKRLIDELIKLPKLKQLHDLATTETGIRLLEDLIRSNSSVAQAVGASRMVIESTDHEIGELKVLKGIHDALHTIEAECLVPMRGEASAERLWRSKFVFKAPCASIRAAVEAHRPADPLLEDLVDRLDVIADKFTAADPSDAGAGRDAILSELEQLISFFPDRLDGLISSAAKRLQLDSLIMLMARVRGVLPATAAEDSELKPLLDTIAALERLRDRLDQLVREHGVLQGLDLRLRGLRAMDALAAGKPLAIRSEWEQIERQRGRLTPILSPELQQAGIAELDQVALQTKAMVERGDDRAAIASFESYFYMVTVVFRALDSSLKNFCADLDRESAGLRTILRQLESRHG